jgi:hypothetical protein
MAYIGKSPVLGNFVKLDAISVVNGQAAYTMQNGGSNFTDYESVNQFLVSLNGTIQAPTDSFTVSGSTLTFASNLATGDVIDFIMVFGNSLSAGTPTDATVTAAKLNNDIISGQTALASEPADTDEFLVSDAGTLKRIDYSLIKGGGLTMADQWRLNSTYTVTNSSAVLTNLEQVDTDGFGGIGTAMTQSSGIFTFPTTGIWLITGTAYLYRENSGSANVTLQLQTTTDNSSYNGAAISAAIVENVSAYEANINLSFMFDVTNTTNCKCKFMASSNNNNIATMYAETAQNTTYFTFLRLGDT